MKKKVLNNKGFAVSMIIYTSVTLVVLILILIVSILSTGFQSKNLIVDDIKEEVSGTLDKKSESLGDIIITTSDSKMSGQWHTADFNLIFSKPAQNGTEVSFPVTYYYGTSVDDVNTVLSGNTLSVTSDTEGTSYFVRACRGSGKDVCSKVGTYLVRMDKLPPTIEVTGASTTWATSRTLNVTFTALSKIAYYEYYVSDFTNTPTELDELKTFTSNQIVINEPGKYIFIRPINGATVKGDWKPYNLYVQASS